MDAETERRIAHLLHHRTARLAPGQSVALPIVSSTTFHSPDVADLSHVYGRSGMPTWEALEDQLSLLEDAPCVAFPSGMAAISAALFAGLGAGKRLILPADGYYVGRLLADRVLRPYGVDVQELPTAAYETADFTGAALVLVETPSNPRLDVCDISAIAARVHAAGGLLVADNTTMTPLLQRPLDLGADVVVAADTKAPAGHSDALFGHVASRNAAFMEQVREGRRLTGAVPGSFEAWLVHRGIETLEVRLTRMCASAQTIAERLAAHPKIARVRYPGLPHDPSYAVARRQMTGFGFLIGFELANAAEAERFLSACPLIAETTSFGSTHTSGERRIRWGDAVPEGFVRLSVGIEPVEPLWAAIADTLEG